MGKNVNEDQEVHEAENYSGETALHHVADVVVGKFSCEQVVSLLNGQVVVL